MKKSYLLAAGMAVAVASWIGSGFIGDAAVPEDVEAPEAMEAEPAVVPQVRVQTSRAEDHAGELILFGRTEADRTVELRAETLGTVAEILVEKGDAVEEGAPIARLAMDDRKARLREAEARVSQARIAYDAALKLSKKEFRSKVKLAEEKATLESARAQLAAIRLDIERIEIQAPFAGVVDDLPVEVGDYLAVGATVARLLDLDPLVVAVEVAEKDVAGVTLGDAVRVRPVSHGAMEGAVRYVSKRGSQATRTFRVEVAVPNADAALAEGLTTEVRLPTGTARAHRISPSILTLDDRGVVGVKAVDDEGRVVFHEVAMVADTPDGVWLSGLPDSLRLITVGQEFVKAGQAVQPREEGDGR